MARALWQAPAMEGPCPFDENRLLALLLPLATPALAVDTDRDGVEDASDACPASREDIDGDRDHDGCPDVVNPLDIDGDTVLNIMDKCPTEPGGHSGCPSKIALLKQVGDTTGKAGDSDGDGVANAADQCPLGVEDKDGDRDHDGCPDVIAAGDQDGDTVPNLLDKCPFAPGGDQGCPAAPKPAPKTSQPTPTLKPLPSGTARSDSPPAGPALPATAPVNHPSWPVIRHRHTHRCHGQLVKSAITSDLFFKCDNGDLVHLYLSGAKLPDNAKPGMKGVLFHNPKFSGPMEWNMGWIDLDGGGQIVPVRDGDSGCFLTTAATRAMGEPDDGPTLTTLRRFRDGVMRNDPVWNALIEEYYRIAPDIVRHTQAHARAEDIWRVVATDYLEPIVDLIHAGRHDEAVAGYRRLVLDLSAAGRHDERTMTAGIP